MKPRLLLLLNILLSGESEKKVAKVHAPAFTFHNFQNVTMNKNYKKVGANMYQPEKSENSVTFY